MDHVTVRAAPGQSWSGERTACGHHAGLSEAGLSGAGLSGAGLSAAGLSHTACSANNGSFTVVLVGMLEGFVYVQNSGIKVLYIT